MDPITYPLWSFAVCSGGDNRKSRKQVDAENEAAKRQYEYQLEVRKREWNQALSIYGANKIDFKTAQERAGRKLGNAYAKLDIALYEKKTAAKVSYSDVKPFDLVSDNFEYIVQRINNIRDGAEVVGDE